MKSALQQLVGFFFLYLTITGHGIASAANVNAGLSQTDPLLPMTMPRSSPSINSWLLTGTFAGTALLASAGLFFGTPQLQSPVMTRQIAARSVGTIPRTVSMSPRNFRVNAMPDLNIAPQAPTEQAQPAQEKGGDLMLSKKKELRYFELVDAVVNDQIEKVSLTEDGATGRAIDKEGRFYRLANVPVTLDLFKILREHNVEVAILPAQNQQSNPLLNFAGSIVVPIIIFTIIGFFLSRGNQGGGQGGGGGGGPFGGGMNPTQFGRTRSKIEMQPNTGVTFDQVAGNDEAKQELMEIVEFLKSPEKFTKLGAKVPKGVIMEGPPGTGKTLLARATAGEAQVPFVSSAGSEFVELFVGVGASRVRDLFEMAKKNAPCIIFIDEIDAIGRQRGTGIAGGNDEREQTLNQILTQMDGFEGNTGVIVLAATNRADVLDPALLRPGRFDRRVQVGLPDFKGRIAILKVHARGKPLAEGVDLSAIARRTPGFSGASLEALMNEAAIYAARANKTVIEYTDIDSAIDRVLVGIEKNGDASSLMRRSDLVAYHEAGHAIVGALMNGYDAVQKVTIIPRTGGAGGLTFFEPNEVRLESGMYSRSYLEGQLAVALGGRVAEELVFGQDEVTTGASNDIQQVTNIAKRMVSEWGFSDLVGHVAVSDSGGNPFLGRQMAMGGSSWSQEKIKMVDAEVDRIVKNAYQVCKEMLSTNRALLDDLAEKLIEQETVSGQELYDMVAASGAETVLYNPVSHKGAPVSA
mmetsp:Transcript_18679/g.26051  ORF Transcript_18679/g.26051 Transcript_18679/m.26051 type:complete len:750 (+) Transcript_18679:116-2365(+)|eukprot:CAMPEP_0184486746 /NCGR_PEP_ID=MMETSP0113_2-20130426/8483_1 /TAXON_ID=91329 /ORGANISM="Norrisiella sphaerica, Strain BC52" /LENGTH=749 /DNA_ID=CAMNT_0026868763 /DNA_START=99 /DNA_END=2348 /DNA_ORIENTATION=+